MSNVPDFLPSAYLPQQSETARRLDAQGMLLHYQPRRFMPADYGMDAQQTAPDFSHLSWPAYKTANRFEATDYEDKKRIWSAYRDQVIPQIAQATGEGYEGLQQLFDQTYANERPKKPKRSILEGFGDTAVTLASSATSAIKTIPDLIDPTSKVSRFLDEDIIKPLGRAKSAVMQDEEMRRQREVSEAKAQGHTGIAATLDYYLRNPVQAVAEAVGAIAPFAASGGAMAAARLGTGTRAAIQTLVGSSMGAGEVRGNIWDKVNALSDNDLMAASPEYAQLRQTMTEAQAKEAIGANLSRNLPELAGAAAIGGVAGRFGVEPALAGLPTKSGRLGTALTETAQEATQGGIEQLATNYGVRRGLPSQSLSEDVLLNAASEGVLGGIAGGAIGGHRVTQNQSADLMASAPHAEQSLALPTPNINNIRPSAQNSAYLVEQEDIDAVLSTLPKIINRNYIAHHLDADMRNGTLEETAKQKNSLGRAATALLERIEQRSQLQQHEVEQVATTADPTNEIVSDAISQAQQAVQENTPAMIQQPAAAETQSPQAMQPSMPDVQAEPELKQAVGFSRAPPEEAIVNQPAPLREGFSVSRQEKISQNGLNLDTLRQALAKEEANKNIDLYPSLDEVPVHLRQQAEQIGAQDIEGFFDPHTNRVALIANNIRSPERALEVARHELIGHYGLENMVGQNAMRELARKVATAERLGNKLLKKIAAQVDRTQPNLDSETRAKEIIALMAEQNLHNHVVRRVLDSVRQFLKKAGLLKSDLTDAQIAKLLRDAQRYLSERGRERIAGNPAPRLFSKREVNRVDSIDEVLKAAATDKNDRVEYVIGVVSFEQISDIAQATGLDTTGYNHVIDNYAIKHAKNRHSNVAIEKARGQIALKDNDIRAIPDVVQSPDTVVYGGKNEREQPQIAYIKRLADGSLLAVEEIRKGRKTLAVASLRKYPATKDTDAIIRTLFPHVLNDGRNKPIVVHKNGTDNAAKFSRSGVATRQASAIPLAKNIPTIKERIQALSKNSNELKTSAKTLLSEGGKAPQPKWLEDAVTMLFDDRNPLEQAVRRSGNTAEGKKFLHTLRTFEAATQKTVHDFEKKQIDPMMDALRGAWSQTFKKMDWYQTHGWQQFLMDIGTIGNLIKHGRERNQEIARKTQGKDLVGSGRSDAEINTIERELRNAAPGLIELYEKIYNDYLKPMLDYRDQTLRDAGLLTAEMEQDRPNYQWYVPLFGDPNQTEDSFAHQAASGKSLKSPQEKQAMGRSGTLADNVLQNVLEATQTAIQRAGMQTMKKDLLTWVKSDKRAKGSLSAKINETTHKEIFEKYVGPDGLVYERVKPNAAFSPDAVVLRDGNKTTILHIGNQKILNALKGVDRGVIDGLFAIPTKATRMLSAIYTRYNPVFPLMNKLRDTQSQLSFLLADAPITDKAATFRNVLANNLRYSTEWKNKPGSEYQTWREKYEQLGGATMYSDLFTDDVMRNLEDNFAQMIGADSRYKLKAAATKVGDFIDRVNAHMEMSSRVALFKGLVDAGMSEKDAALYTKNTMNFEIKGKLGRQLGALYAFAGPALFDARRMVQALRTPQGSIVMLAHFALMYGLYSALKSMGGEDDDGIDKLNKIPLSQSGRFLTLIDADDPEKKGWKFPVGFGFGRISLTLAAAVHRLMDGVDDTGEFVGNVAKEALLSNFSPLEPIDINPSKDLAGWAMQQFMPTIAKPLLQLAMNQTGQGSPIHKPDEWTGNKLKITQAWPQTSMLFKQAAKSIYESTGIDVYPETLAFLLRSYGGGGAMEAVRAMQLLGEKAEVEISLSDVPLAQAFSSKSSSYDMVRFREKLNTLQKLKNERDYAREQGSLDEFDETHPNVEQQLALYKQANKSIKALYKERKLALAGEDAAHRQQQVKELNQRIRTIYIRVNQLQGELE